MCVRAADVVLSGGSTMFPNMQERMEREVQAQAPTHAKVRVIAPAERVFSVWIGGAILSGLSSFEEVRARACVRVCVCVRAMSLSVFVPLSWYVCIPVCVCICVCVCVSCLFVGCVTP